MYTWIIHVEYDKHQSLHDWDSGKKTDRGDEGLIMLSCREGGELNSKPDIVYNGRWVVHVMLFGGRGGVYFNN